MNKIIKTLIVLLSLHSGVVYAWSLFEPKNYDDCILEAMKGVTSDTAAKHIARSCREKFPQKEQTPRCKETSFSESEIKDLKSDVKISGYQTLFLTVTIYNASRNKTIREIEIELGNEQDSEKQFYLLETSSFIETGLQPLSSGDFKTQIQKPKYKEVVYAVKAVRGCQL